VTDKSAALRGFHRVLKPGGRISIAEPILQDDTFFARALRRRVDTEPLGSHDRFLTLLHRWKAAQFPDTEELCAKSPITNYSERDLLYFVRSAGFTEIHLQLHIDVAPSLITSWQVFFNSSPHPWAPPLSVILGGSRGFLRRQFRIQLNTPSRTRCVCSVTSSRRSRHLCIHRRAS